MTQPDPKVLSALFSGINKEILMNAFDDKLKVQKLTYIAQRCGIDLGYDFEWYLRGPYCKQVSEDAHRVIDSKITASPSEVGLDVEKVRKFSDMITKYKDDAEWLEIAGSLDYLRNEHYAGRDIKEIVGYMLTDLSSGYKNFTDSLVRSVLIDTIKLGLIK